MPNFESIYLLFCKHCFLKSGWSFYQVLGLLLTPDVPFKAGATEILEDQAGVWPICCETSSHTSGNPRGPELAAHPTSPSFSHSPSLLARILGKKSPFSPPREEAKRGFIRSSVREGRGWNLIYSCHLKERWGNPQKQMLWNIPEKTPSKSEGGLLTVYFTT